MKLWKKILITVGVFLTSAIINGACVTAGIILGGFPTVLLWTPFFICLAWCRKKTTENKKQFKREKSNSQNLSDRVWQFRVYFSDGKYRKKNVALSKKDYDAVNTAFKNEIPLNGSCDIEYILNKVKSELSAQLNREIESIEFCDDNYD